MKILNAMFGCGLGGIEQALVDYCEALAFCGHEAIALIHPRADVRSLLMARNIPFHALPNAGVWDPIAVFRLKRLLAKLAPDACIAHGNRAVGLLTRAAPPCGVIGVMHNYKIKSDRVQNVFYPTQDLLRHISTTDTQGKQLILIPNMVRVPAQLAERVQHTPPVIGAMGRCVAKKGFALFIEALALLKSRGIVFSAILAGDGEELPALKRLVVERGLSDHIRFSGWVEDKQTFFDSIDVFCLPSHHEPFGIVLLEAMAQGLPVVATRSEGPSEILTEKSGLLVAKGESVMLADALAELLKNPDTARMLARGGYHRVKTQYDLPIIAGKLDLALHQLRHL